MGSVAACLNAVRYQSRAATRIDDRVCKTITVCAADEVEAKKSTATADRVCMKIPKSCKDLVGVETENGVYKIKPDGSPSEFDAYCNMKRDGGGWTLVLINSDDGNPSVFRGASLPQGLDKRSKGKHFGSNTQRNVDYKGKEYDFVKWTDMMFIVNPDSNNAENRQLWAAYKNVYPKGDRPWPDWWHDRLYAQNDGADRNKGDSWGHTLRCYQGKVSTGGYKMTAGNLKANQGKMCNTNLYIDVMDMDGNVNNCGSDEDSWGPTWNTRQGGRCPFDDPGMYSTIFGRTRNGNEPFGAKNLGFGAGAEWVSNSYQNNKKNIHIFVR